MSRDPNTPTSGTKANADGNIKDSLAALRRVLMIDTPTKSLLDGRPPTVSMQQSRYEEQKKHRQDIEKLKSATSELENKVQEATREASKEMQMRKTLETTYEALTRHKRELTMQLELVSKSREIAEDKLASTSKELQSEKAEFSREREAWKPELDQLKRTKDALTNKCGDLRTRYEEAARKAKEFEERVETLTREQTANQTQIATHQSQLFGLQPQLDQSEAARKKAEDELKKTTKENETLKRRHVKSLDSMLQIQQSIKKQLKDCQMEKKSVEETLEKFNGGLSSTNSLLADALENQSVSSVEALDSIVQKAMQTCRIEAAEQIFKHVSSALQAVKAGNKSLELTNENLESQLQVAKGASEKSSLELASTREELRSVRDLLSIAQEERDESQQRIKSLEEQLQQSSSENESDNKEDSAEEYGNDSDGDDRRVDRPYAKRQKTSHDDEDSADEYEVIV